jgi:DNA-binding response OmpR family regulator
MASILIVDDDSEVLGTVGRALNREGHTVTLADSAAEAWQHLSSRRPDMIVLDIMMPQEDGIQFCKRLRADSQYNTIPVLFLSARWRTEDVVQGLDAGGDDYLTKPFELAELNARVRAVLRRVPEAVDPPAFLRVGDLALDPKTFQASTAKRPDIQLTSTEFRLLHYLMSAPNRAHSIRMLLDSVWGYPDGSGDPDLVRAHIRNLRSKLESNADQPAHILTIHGVGYMVRE